MRFLVAALLCGGCAMNVEAYRKTYCNYDGAFKRGEDDAEYHRKTNEQFISYCLADQKAHAENGYRNGYMTTAGSTLGRIVP